jgi:2-polyprenyl-6-methoxyphenol hydroxylase-like FAD-dependent oxidoreductase
MRVGIVGGSIAGRATAALLHRAGHDVIVFERSESDLVSRGAGIVAATAAWQDMTATGLIDGTLPACRADCAAQLIPIAEGIERSYVFGLPDLTTMPTTATNDWMSAAHPGLVITLPGV